MLSLILQYISVIHLAGLLLFAAVGGKLLYNVYGGGLSAIPGPLLASCTDLWRVFVVWGRRPEVAHVKLHQKHGNIVRLGPRNVIISDPSALPIVYGTSTGFTKSNFYPVQQNLAKGKPLESLFNTTNEKYHATLRRAVSNAFAMTSLLQLEPLVDSTITAFLQALDERFANKQGPEGVCDLGTWLQFFAFDVIGELTFSKRLGFVDRGVDVEGIIGSLEASLNYAAVVGQMPISDFFLKKNPLRLWASKIGLLNASAPVVSFAATRLAERQSSLENMSDGKAEGTDASSGADFLARYWKAHLKDPSFMTRDRMLAVTVSNMFAGSDTTAISLRSVFYNLIKHPQDMEDLLAELSQGRERGVISVTEDGLHKWSEVKDLPYLGAVIKEALRVHPAVGLPLERIVPASGVELCGHFLPPGTIVGCSAWAVHLDKVFGDRPQEFRPRRWLEASPEQYKAMEKAFLAFGAGARTCVGKNISLLEIYKLVPAFLTRFNIDLVKPDAPWQLHNAWFVKQSGVNVRLERK